MPDLIIEPELGDSIHECFDHAYSRLCLDKRLRSARFSFNGLLVTIAKENQ